MLKRVGEQAARLEAGSGCVAAGGTRASSRSGATSPPQISTKSRPTIQVWLTNSDRTLRRGEQLCAQDGGDRKSTNDPPAGTIDRDGQGNPTGCSKSRQWAS